MKITTYAYKQLCESYCLFLVSFIVVSFHCCFITFLLMACRVGTLFVLWIGRLNRQWKHRLGWRYFDLCYGRSFRIIDLWSQGASLVKSLVGMAWYRLQLEQGVSYLNQWEVAHRHHDSLLRKLRKTSFRSSYLKAC